MVWVIISPAFHYKLFAHRSPFLVCTVLWDLGWAVGFIMTAVIQARYLPRPLGSCENLDQLDNPDNGGKNWLDVLVDSDTQLPTFKDGFSVCLGETMAWRMTIAYG